MDKRKDIISSLKICRFCLTQNVPMSSLYDKKRKIKNTVNLPLKILSCVSVEVFPSDKMPTYICERCKYFMNLCYDFKNICRQADEAILHYIQDNKPIKAIPWPMSLNEAYRESNEIGVMKTIVEGGTTVQVTHDITDSEEEEEEENVYNVKISDGTDEVSKTCVKVVASRDNEDKLEKGSGENCWPCDQCSCTYPLQQMLELHKNKKHRQRNVHCDRCDEKFFNKYDLATHQLRHTVAMPFACIICNRKFKRLILLKRHEKLMHADLANQLCPQCPASFLTPEKLDDHMKKHERHASRTFCCLLCGKKFLEKATLQRHIQFLHNRKLDFGCKYCTQRFSSVTKLSKHVRSHAGERPYPCKYCDKTFMKSHHYTRHVRMKHREEERAGAGNSDAYPCEQCDETFGGQDELIYHSAIHATQNLTCPLCQEKFENVDDVTAHIKSHVNGMEFMCDFCELVFTTKEKLENHMLITHEDEIQNELGQDESSMDMEDMKDGEGDDEDDDDNSINVKEEDDHNMVIEIKKADEFLLKNRKTAEATEAEEKLGDNSSEDSDAERNYMERATIGKLATVKMVKEAAKPVGAVKSVPQAKPVNAEKFIVGKSEDIKRASIQQRLRACDSPTDKKEKQVMAQITKIETGNDKSLRLLEKELQDLKRTNSRSEAVKTPPVKMVETPRGRGRPPLHSSTPKIKPTEEKKSLAVAKSPVVEKKQVEKKVITKENKEPKVVKETKPNNHKEDKDTSKSVVKNGTNEKSGVEDGIRRSTRPCKIKDYAKMIRVNTQDNSDSEEIDDDDDEYREGDKTMDGRVRARRNSVRPTKSSPAPAAPVPTTPTTVASPTTPSTPTGVPPRKRGRPRKEQPKEIPSKIKKTDPESELEQTSEAMEEKSPPEPNKPIADRNPSSVDTNPSSAAANQANPVTEQSSADLKQDEESQDSNMTEPEPETENKRSEPTLKEEAKSKPDEGKKVNSEERKSPHVEPKALQSPSTIISPTGQTLKKIPIRSLPPGVKPLPLPLVGRSLPTGELCQMQIGKKVVKVQKIVMTKAEVEAMAKQGLVEMKDGTMVLKQGVKIPKVEPLTVRPVAAEDKDSPGKKERAAPTRCNFGDE